jgi:hypothetical protein
MARSLRQIIDSREATLSRMSGEWAGLIAHGDFLSPGDLNRAGELWAGIQKRSPELEHLRGQYRKQRAALDARAAELLGRPVGSAR